MTGQPPELPLADLLEQEIAALETVLDALDAEQQALESRNAEALTSATQLKVQRIEAAKVRSEARHRQVPDAAAVPDDPELRQRWESLRDLAEACKARNERNGLMISVQRRNLEQTLAVLRNETPEPALYGPDGDSPQRSRRGGLLGSA